MPRSTRGRPPHPDLLTPAEWRVLTGIQHGQSNPALARRLGVSLDAIKYHVRNILGKTGQRSRLQLRQLTLIPAGTALASQQENPSMEPADIGPLGQIARTVANIEQARNWYELVLELPHLYTFGTLSFFDCGGTRLMLSQAETVNMHESLLYFRVADILGTCERLQQKGVSFISAPHMIHRHADGTEEWMAFFRDQEARPLALMAQVRPAATGS